ncbi:hypothetical protein HLB44_20720 [Aquincola sp. S2]|uniref:HTH luxR-type domain-containing protein n=1 Tax=Pseudaquabacterium terrae TaxID=2732868 RepID=A0ABX2ELE8_9BURK|nr:hypothetical protein [Aquabacterium terrae]NRF69428.1 hypothetical protein [Aquabacterium terrae]
MRRNNSFKSLVDCVQPEEVAVALLEAAQCIGFPAVNMTMVMVEDSPITLRCIKRSPTVVEYDRALAVGSSLGGPLFPADDPVLTGMRRGELPIVWGQSTYLNVGMADFHDALRKADAGNGLALRNTIPMRATAMPAAVLLMLPRHEAIRSAEADPLIGDLAHLALYTLDAAKRVLYPRLHAERRRTSPLTPAMTTYLSLSATGLSVKETARIVGRSPATVNNVLHEALYRTDSKDKLEAIRKCRANGWLTTDLELD